MLTIAHASRLSSLEPDLAVCAEPAFVVDPVAATLHAANRLGWQVWGIDPDTVRPPIAIDAAMPALHSLRGRAALGSIGSASPPSRANLVFWTFGGLVRMQCQIEPAGGDAPGWVIRVLACEPAPGIAVPAGQRAKAVADGPRDARGHPPTAKAPELALTAKLAHELRTPLSAVIAYAEILKDEHFGPLADARYRGYANDICNSARHALGVVDGMLQERGARLRSAAAGVRRSRSGVRYRQLSHRCTAPGGAGRSRAGVEYAPRLPARHCRRAQPQADADQPARQRHQVHSPWRQDNGERRPTSATGPCASRSRTPALALLPPSMGSRIDQSFCRRMAAQMRGWASACRSPRCSRQRMAPPSRWKADLAMERG